MKRDFVLNRLLRSARLICSRLNFGRYLPRVGSPEHPQRDLILETAYPIPCRRSALSELLIFGSGLTERITCIQNVANKSHKRLNLISGREWGATQDNVHCTDQAYTRVWVSCCASPSHLLQLERVRLSAP
ncbi:hypothetical protein TNCV_5015141 [Trichonephila clavipes]|nr:hypothetical protein TNCV_5015141 [Trichonephila clavipes]